MSADLRPGSVIAYPYLWRWQKDRDETEGRKSRPVCVVAAVRSADGLTHLALLAISSRPPGADQVAVEVPEIECRRAGLSDLRRAWVTVSEYNYDVGERSFYLEPGQPALGRFWPHIHAGDRHGGGALVQAPQIARRSDRMTQGRILSSGTLLARQWTGRNA